MSNIFRTETCRHILIVLSFGCVGWVSGCAGLQDYRYENQQRWRAVKAYLADPAAAPERHAADYRRGWLDGYQDTVTGGPGIAPAVPPSRYWDPQQVIKHGNAKRNAYYLGWTRGSNLAASEPDSHTLPLHEVVPHCEDVATRCGNGSTLIIEPIGAGIP